MCKNEAEAKLKLREAYDPALMALSVKPEMTFNPADGKVKIESPISAEAGLGPFTIEVQAVRPMQMSGTLTPSTIQGEVEVGGRKYKYSADLEFTVQVTFKPKPGDQVKEPVREMQSQSETAPAFNPISDSIDWHKIGEQAKEIFVVVTIGLISAAGVVVGAWHIQANGLAGQGASSITPFIHSIDPHYLQNINRNQDVI